MLSSSTYEGSFSALSHLYHDSGNNKEATYPQLWPKLSSYKKGSRIIAVSEKQYLGLNLIKGMMALSFQAYKRLAKIIFEARRLNTLLLTPFQF